MNKTINKSISIPIDLYEKLLKLCESENRGFSNLVTMLILRGLKMVKVNKFRIFLMANPCQEKNTTKPFLSSETLLTRKHLFCNVEVYGYKD